MVTLPSALLAQLNDSLAKGTYWQTALSRATRGTDLESTAALIGRGNLANWTWLTDIQGRNDVLDVSGGLGVMTASLSAHFHTVVFAESDDQRLTFSRRRLAQDGIDNVRFVRTDPSDPPFARESFDCVVMHAVLDRLGPDLRVTATPLLRTYHEILRPGGCLYLGAANPYWYGNLRTRLRGGPSPLSALGPNSSVVRTVRLAGFRDITPYYVFPSLDYPGRIMPATRHAVAAYQGPFAPRGARGASRRLIIGLGLHALLFPSLLVLAHR